MFQIQESNYLCWNVVELKPELQVQVKKHLQKLL